MGKPTDPRRRPPLWTCLYFPQLLLDRQAQHSGDADVPLAIVQHTGASRWIVAANAAARAAGVQRGLPLSSAYALLPGLEVREADEIAQAAHLRQLALWALQYSSWVTPREPDCILLEIRASLRLHGGLDALLSRLRADAMAQGVTMALGTAPTPAAATLLAQADRATPVLGIQGIAAALDDLPVPCLPLDAFTLQGLQQSGVRTLGALRRLEPATLTRRFGPACTELLYRIDGTLPDPCPAFVAPDTFELGLDLPLEAPDVQALAFPLNRLIGALAGYLRTRDHGAGRVELTLFHHRLAPTVIDIRFLDPATRQAHLYRVCTERLAATPLPAPVIRIQLQAHDLGRLARNEHDLFDKGRAQGHSVQQIIDTLIARLGRQRLYTAMTTDDHRPEKAWIAAMMDAERMPGDWPARPLWLLREPRPAEQPLTLISGAERIENGWWDSLDVRRDYYLACDERGSTYWVFRQRHDATQTYIHGIFA